MVITDNLIRDNTGRNRNSIGLISIEDQAITIEGNTFRNYNTGLSFIRSAGIVHNNNGCFLANPLVSSGIPTPTVINNNLSLPIC